MSASQQAPDSAAKQAAREASRALKGRSRAGGVALAGIVLTGLAGGALLIGNAPHASKTGQAEVMTVAASDMANASSTLDPAKATALITEAKACRAPLAYIALSNSSGTKDSVIRIRSGAYLSPFYHVGATPVRIAIPFPTPYSVGRGQLTVEGQQNGLRVTLYPTWESPGGPDGTVINIWWTTDQPCGA